MEDIHAEYPSNLYYATSGKQMVFDIFIPSLKLAIEYQGEQHFKNIYNTTEDSRMSQQERFSWKRKQVDN